MQPHAKSELFGDYPQVRRLDGFSPRQTQIFELLEHGYCNKEIAHLIGISEATVKCHIGNIMRRTGCRNRTQLALLSLRLKHGLRLPKHYSRQ